MTAGVLDRPVPDIKPSSIEGNEGRNLNDCVMAKYLFRVTLFDELHAEVSFVDGNS
jgi:hypothetical protein